MDQNGAIFACIENLYKNKVFLSTGIELMFLLKLSLLMVMLPPVLLWKMFKFIFSWPTLHHIFTQFIPVFFHHLRKCIFLVSSLESFKTCTITKNRFITLKFWPQWDGFNNNGYQFLFLQLHIFGIIYLRKRKFLIQINKFCVIYMMQKSRRYIM